MSVYTPLDLADVNSWLAGYGLPAANTLTPIKSGIENSNFFVGLGDGREFVLTLFEELNAADAAFLGPLLAHLDRAGIPVAAPLADGRGQRLGMLAGKPAQLAPRIAGQHPLTPDAATCATMGQALAKLHVALRDYPLARANSHGADWWAAVAERQHPHLDADGQRLLDRLRQQHADTLRRHPNLPQGLIHGDLFRDNTLYDNTPDAGPALRAVLDFSECSRDYWLLDIAITLNDFCRQWPGDAPDAQRRDAFLAAYASVRPLTADERAALPVFMATAAMRFWLSRLEVASRNAEEARTGEHVLEKNPQEMRSLAAALLTSTC
ncbi:MAG: homoserine kinase [Moraxellaceae bacterium]|nr:homoserine kinase [Moraxellaceae bacterium]